MPDDLQRADRGFRRTTAITLATAVFAALVLVLGFERWLSHWANQLPTTHLVVQLRHGIGWATLAIAFCLLLLAGYAARLGRRIHEEHRWPLAATRVLRDTQIRRDDAAKVIANRLTAAALLLVLLAVASALVGWRLFSAGH